MSGSGNADLTVKFTLTEPDMTTYAVSSATGNAIVNQLDHADLNKVDDDPANDIVYVSRSNWEGTMPQASIGEGIYKAAVQIEANDVIAKGLAGPVSYPGSTEMPTFAKEGELTLVPSMHVPLDGNLT